MSRSSEQHADKSTEGMVDYDHNSLMQRRLLNTHTATIQHSVAELGVVEPEFRVVDYGCGPGRSAIDAVRPAIEAYRKLSRTAPMAICHADQAGNDWNGLVELVFGPNGYAHKDPAIRTETSIGSFYETMAPPASVSLGTCFTAVHWMSRAIHPRPSETTVFSDLTGEARADFVALADADWTTFLRHRARELCPGGHLVVTGLGAVGDASEPNGVAITSRRLYRAMELVLREMADEGSIDRHVLSRFVWPIWIRTLDELRAPIEREPDLKEAFEIEQLAVEPATVNPLDVFGDEISQPAHYAAHYAGYVGGFGASTLRLQVFEPSAMDGAEAENLENEFFRRLGKLYEESPGKYAAETWVSTIVLRRR